MCPQRLNVLLHAGRTRTHDILCTRCTCIYDRINIIYMYLSYLNEQVCTYVSNGSVYNHNRLLIMIFHIQLSIPVFPVVSLPDMPELIASHQWPALPTHMKTYTQLHPHICTDRNTGNEMWEREITCKYAYSHVCD